MIAGGAQPQSRVFVDSGMNAPLEWRAASA
jgi:hypothetical protein